ncbi:hypothetical protein GT354_43790 [Streptomyces sp. SID3343]|nr:hypothetical protein [Streptomyces sp. SID3343]
MPAGTPGGTIPRSLPSFVGQGLQSAQDGAQAAGFSRLKSTDALGQNRYQVWDRNWKVCSQNPQPGLIDPDATITFAAVKLEETCPGTAGAESPGAVVPGTAMPDLVGKGVKAARGALPAGAAVTVKDVSGRDRIVIVESNWKVCTQEPAAGAVYSGQPVRLGAAKTEEKCG